MRVFDPTALFPCITEFQAQKKKKIGEESLGSFLGHNKTGSNQRSQNFMQKNALLAFGKIHVKPKLRGQEGAMELRTLRKSRKYHPIRFHDVLASLCKLGA